MQGEQAKRPDKPRRRMSPSEVEQFKKEFKSIIFKNSQIADAKTKLRSLHAWDKNGSHEKAILRQLDQIEKYKDELKVLLKGKSYEEWRLMSKKITQVSGKLKTATSNKIKAEAEIESIKF